MLRSANMEIIGACEVAFSAARPATDIMSDLYVMRHAQASFGAVDYDQLSPLGRTQARILGEFLRQARIRFDAAYSGFLERQRETAHILISSLSSGDDPPRVKALQGLNEYDSKGLIQEQIAEIVGEDASLSEDIPRIASDRRSLQRVLEAAMTRWMTGLYDIPGIESYRAFTDRVRQAFAALMNEAPRGSRIAVVTSGGPISIVMQMALGLSPEETLRLAWQVRNASVSTFKFNQERITLASFNSTAHLEQRGDPALLTYR